jgi:DNA-binding beta-propeller fold protein YncE
MTFSLTPTSTGTSTPTPICCQGITSLNGFNKPEGATIDYQINRLYVCDRINNSLHVFTETGAVITTFTSWTGGSFNNPTDVAVDNQDNIYIADYQNQKIDVFDLNYNFLTSFATNPVDYPRGIWVENPTSTTTSVYVTGQTGKVFRFDGTGTLVTQSTVFGTGYLNTPTGVVKVGNLVYVASQGTNQVVSFDTSNSYAEAVPVALNFATDMRTDLAGYLYVTSNSQVNVYQLPNFNLVHVCPIPNYPWGVAVNTLGEIFVAEDNATSVTVIQSCESEPALVSNVLKRSGGVGPASTPSPTFTPILTPTETPSNLLPSVIAAPNLSHNGQPIQFRVNLAGTAKVQLTLVNLTGELVYQQTFEGITGLNSLEWNLKNKIGMPVASGIYLYAVRIDGGGMPVLKMGKVLILH